MRTGDRSRVIKETGEVNDLDYVMTSTSNAADNPWLLLVNGYAAGPKDWGSFNTRLAENGVSTIAFQAFREHGPYSLRAVANELWQAVDELGAQEGLDVETVDVAGQSHGSVVTQEFVLQDQNRVGHYVSIVGIPGLPAVQPDRRKLAILNKRERSPEENAELWGGITEEVVAKFIANKDLDKHEQIIFDESEVMRNREKNPAILERQRKSIASPSGAAEAASICLRLMNIRVPTLVLAGGKDPLIHRLNSETLVSLIPNSSSYVVEEAGHGLVYEVRKPEVETSCPTYDKDIAEVVAEFLATPGDKYPAPMAFMSGVFSFARFAHRNPGWGLEILRNLPVSPFSKG
jgi:pimeloyl-ACP methyl ester carboxylesterase